MLTSLRSKGYGCYIGNHYHGSIAYADVVVLLSPNVSSLKAMLKVCEDFSEEYHINFNATKTLEGSMTGKVEGLAQLTPEQAKMIKVILTQLYS